MRKSTADTSNQSVLGADQRHKILIISAVAAHHGPTPAFQTIKLDRVCVGSILKGSRHSGDGQKACFWGFQKCTIFAQQTGPRIKSFRGKCSTPFFCFNGYGLTLNLSENKIFGEIRTKTCISTPIPPFWQGNGTNPAPHLHTRPHTH